MPEEALNDRLTFLNQLSMRKTKEEREGTKMKLHVGVSQGKKKRKLSSGPGEDDLAPPAAKKPKVFTHSAAELVKIVGQYVQATSSGPERRLNPVRTMESILSRIELSRRNQTEGTNPATEPGYLGSVSDDPPVEQPRLAEPRPAKEVRGKGNLRSVRGRNTAFNPMFLTPPPPLGATEARGRGGARDGRGQRNHRFDSRSSSIERPNERQVSFERPIRCANMHYGGFCGTYNYVEAPYCS